MSNKHIFFIDPLEKLVIEKDSSLLWALSLQEKGEEVYFLFEDDFYFDNFSIGRAGDFSLYLYTFSGSYLEDKIYLKNIKLAKKDEYVLGKGDVLYMRIDPPFDGRYLRYLWMLKSLKKSGIRVTNDPEAILLFNEKLFAYEQKNSLETFVGSSLHGFCQFIKRVKVKYLIFKPLDLYQGMGVEKIEIDDAVEEKFLSMVKKYQGPVVVQPFCQSVEQGEVRAIFFKGLHLGSILKVPPKGKFLANIAQGAVFNAYELSKEEMNQCKEISKELQNYSVELIAFDLLDGKVSEVNITCPGLLVEVSKAHERNLTLEMTI